MLILLQRRNRAKDLKKYFLKKLLTATCLDVIFRKSPLRKGTTKEFEP
ncbi:hypothetical protein J2S08_004443 [Bacillus chungangensis]|uniref:Uncharacterized protein n=1 Tax=Bacillus chungangensis TaxID=587633 RepID=A0ABT9WZ11_9BACI|nr:hypothetical protein [Bacillus chungangensis]